MTTVLGKGLDCSQARPIPSNVKNAGYFGMWRYVCSDSSEAGLPGKRLTFNEMHSYLNAHLDVGVHGEDEAQAVLSGYPRGKAQGTQWADYMSSQLNFPKGRVVIAAIDIDIDHDGDLKLPQVAVDYLGGIHDGLQGEYEYGVYGEYSVVLAAHAEKMGRVFVMTNAWDIDTPPAFVNLHQHGTDPRFPGTDYNDILNWNLGTYNQPLGDPPVSVTGPENWDAKDWAAVKANLPAMADWDPTNANNPSVATVLNRLSAMRDGDVGHVDLPEIKSTVTAAQAAISDSLTAIQSAILALENSNGQPLNYSGTVTLHPGTTP